MNQTKNDGSLYERTAAAHKPLRAFKSSQYSLDLLASLALPNILSHSLAHLSQRFLTSCIPGCTEAGPEESGPPASPQLCPLEPC